MFLSRSGLELNKIWSRHYSIIEIDERLRRVQRRAASGDPREQGRYHRALFRAGKHEELVAAGGAHMLPHDAKAKRMAPHIGAYEKAQDNLENARHEHERRGNTAELRAARRQAEEAYDRARNTVHDHARQLGSPAGAFLQPRAEPHFVHMRRVASIHKTSGRSGRGVNEKVHFFDSQQDRDEFHKAMQHHYGDKYEVEPRSREEHGNYYDHPGMANREEPHRVVIRERVKGASFEDWHGDS